MILVWQVIVDGPPQTLYESDYFEAALTFQQRFPAKPPEMTLKPGFCHLVKYVLILIYYIKQKKINLINKNQQESILSIEAVIICVMLSEPNLDSRPSHSLSLAFRRDNDRILAAHPSSNLLSAGHDHDMENSTIL